MIVKASKNISKRKPHFHIDVENLLWLPENLAVFWKNTEGYYLGGNEITASSLHFNNSEEIIGRSDYDLPIKQHEADMLRQGDLRVLQTKKPQTFVRSCTVLGKVQQFIQLKAPLYNEQGEIVGVYGINNFLPQQLNRGIYQALLMAGLSDQELIQLQNENARIKLTKRQLECIKCLIAGKTIKQTALELKLSPRTIEHYMETIKNKLGCTNRMELIAKVMTMQLVDSD